MNDDRQLQFAGKAQLPDQDFLLHFAQGVVVMVIESDLAQAQKFWVPCKLPQFIQITRKKMPGLMRMNACCWAKFTALPISEKLAPVPITTKLCTPAARARSITASRSASKSASARWQ